MQVTVYVYMRFMTEELLSVLLNVTVANIENISENELKREHSDM